MKQEEYFFSCPFCGEQISFLLDLSIDQQDFIEDCEVCCRPIRVQFQVIEEKVEAFNAKNP